MNFEIIFGALNVSILPAWTLLLFFPKARITHALVHSFVYPICLGAFYLVTFALVFVFGIGAVEGSFMTLTGIMDVFSHPLGIFIGWSHYLVFDLFVGAWIARDGRDRDIHHWRLVPCLILTCLLGPVGLLAYAVLRLVSGTGYQLNERLR